MLRSISPYNNTLIAEYALHTPAEVEKIIAQAHRTFLHWRGVNMHERARVLMKVADLLEVRKIELSRLMTQEMGKRIAESVAEIEKCATACRYFAEHAEALLSTQTAASDATKTYIRYEPLGVILAIMPWNFPFWQAFRFLAPHLMAGNVALLKHASNVTGCALAIEALFNEAGAPDALCSILKLSGPSASDVIIHPAIAAVTFTGSTQAGRFVAAVAGKALKKSVLELGGSDPYIVLADADIPSAALECAKSRMINTGQSCVAAKRFLVQQQVYDAFIAHVSAYFQTLKAGDPLDSETTLAPLARTDLCVEVQQQVQSTLTQGAMLYGQSYPREGNVFFPAILTDVVPGMTAFDEEIFGPVAAITRIHTDEEAITLANHSKFGLGAAVFSKDIAHVERIALQLESGMVAINGFVRSDPRIPFGGVKESGYGRELGQHGIHEFTNIKTVTIY